MSEDTNNLNSQSFEEMLEQSFTPLKNRDIVKGTVVRVTPTEVIVDLGFKSDGIISRGEFSEDQTTELTELVKPGDVIDVWIVRVNDGDGNVLCSKKKVDGQIGLKIVEAAFNDKTVVQGKVTEAIKGGLIVNVQGCRVFVPSSQVSNRFVKDLEEFKGKELDFHIIEFDRTGRRTRLIASRRELAEQEANARHNEIFGNMVVGQRIEGKVSRVVDFGAFVDLGGVDALLHVTELSWQRVRKVTDVVNIGDTITAVVKDFDPVAGKISLSLKDAEENPWANMADKYPVGAIIKGIVMRFAQFGAFVQLEQGIDGLVHISHIADRRINKPSDELSVGQEIDVRIIAIDEAAQRISLSKREADAILNPQEDDYEYDDEFVQEDIDNDTIADVE